MPRLLLTEREAALIAESRKQTQLMVQGLERALLLLREVYGNELLDSRSAEYQTRLINLIKETH